MRAKKMSPGPSWNVDAILAAGKLDVGWILVVDFSGLFMRVK